MQASPRLEHYCFVIYAGVEVVGVHAVLWWVSLALVVTGVGAEVFARMQGG